MSFASEQHSVPVGSNSKPGQERIEPDPSIVESLTQMGFSENGSKRAAVATKVKLGYMRAPKVIY